MVSGHRIMLEQLPDGVDSPPDLVGMVVTIGGDEAHHAIRVKRLEVGERVELLDGRGLVARGELRDTRKLSRSGDWALDVVVTEAVRAVPLSPRVEVFASAPKGERLEHMIEQLSQVGAALWAPLVTTRTVVEPRENKLHRLERVSIEACKQCGRAWAMEIGPATALEDAMRFNGVVIVADASGGAVPELVSDRPVRLLVGPEGGWTAAELEQLRAAGAAITRLGAHVMRVETAAVVGAGVLLVAAGS